MATMVRFKLTLHELSPIKLRLSQRRQHWVVGGRDPRFWSGESRVIGSWGLHEILF